MINSLKRDEIMANSINRDQKRRLAFSKYEIKRLIFKSLRRDESLSKDFRIHSSLELNKLPRNSSSVRIKNRCIKTGRSQSVTRFFQLSRITFRELALKGFLPGVTKSSW